MVVDPDKIDVFPFLFFFILAEKIELQTNNFDYHKFQIKFQENCNHLNFHNHIRFSLEPDTLISIE